MPASPEEEWEYWDKKATELRRGELSTVESSATKWSALMAALLGVFGTVAFAGGLTTLDKLGKPWSTLAKGLTSAAAISALAAIILLSLAAGGLLVTKQPGFTPNRLRERFATGASTSLRWLRCGQLAALLAGLLVLSGSAIVLWVEPKSEDPIPPSLVGIVDGTAVCGKLAKSADGKKLMIGTTEVTTGVTNLVPVDACP